MWVDQGGANYTTTDVIAIVTQATGSTPATVDLIRVGGIYQNGTLWYQRIS